MASYGFESIEDPRFALAMDEADPLKAMRDEFNIPKFNDVLLTARGLYSHGM